MSLVLQQQQHQDSWKENKNRVKKEAPATFCKNTGQDCLAVHLYTFKILDSKECTLCQEINSVMDKWNYENNKYGYE